MNTYQKKYEYYYKTGNLCKLYKYHRKINKVQQDGGYNLEINNAKKDIAKIKKEIEKKRIISVDLVTQFIDGSFDIDSFERMLEINEESGFEKYEYSQFIKHNKKCLERLSDEDLSFIIDLVIKIQNEEIVQCDEDNFIEWDTSTIYFNKKGKLVLMHPR